ncbi:MAG: Abnormal spindle-like microcephaly-assocd, ASPM-SPD-2-Hydin [Labilithrix sp.]|nr:Abnormal spindle-like microcephaly-assocd, ASPM-SPD-2-Hydin [Labilithrix sp.]
MLSSLRTLLAVVVGAGTLAACAALAGIDTAAEPLPGGGAEPEDASLVVDGSIQTPEGITISPSELVLPAMACQATQSGPITITNNGLAGLPYKVVLTEHPAFTLRGATGGVLEGNVERGGFVLVYVDAKGTSPGPQTADVVVQAGSSVQQIKVNTTVTGGLLALNPSLVDFGELRQNTSATVPVELRNDGNQQLSVTGFAGTTSDFSLSQATVVIPAGEKRSIDVTMNGGAASDTVTQVQLTPQLEGASCSPPPVLTLAGKRVNQEVTVGPLAADLGDFDCGATPSNEARIVVTNYATAKTARYEATLLSATSRFTIVSGGAGTVNQAFGAQQPTKAEIVVGVKPIAPPLGEISEDLEVKILAPPEAVATKIVRLQVGAYGAILEVTPASLSGFAFNETKAFTIKNVGNARTCVRYIDIVNNGYYIEEDDELAANETGDLRVQFAAEKKGTFNYAVPITRGTCFGRNAPFCVPPPSPSVSARR